MFKVARNAIVRKPGEPDYSVPEAYRPVALLSSLGKVLESVMATRLMWAIEQYGLLPRSHLGGSKGLSSEDAVHVLIEQIHTAWKRKGVASLLCLDAQNAFENVSHKRLFHCLRKRRVGGTTLEWIQTFFYERFNILELGEHKSPKSEVGSGIPRGSPISSVLYLFYNADLLEDCTEPDNHVQTIGHLDNVAIMVMGDSAEENVEQLHRIHETKAQAWATKHASVLVPARYQLMHFYPPWGKDQDLGEDQSPDIIEDDDQGEYGRGPALELPGHTIRPLKHLNHLELIFDQRLAFDTHVNHLEAECSKRLALFNAPAASTSGIGTLDLMRIYNETVLPQFLYCSSAWYLPKGGIYDRQRRARYFTFLEQMRRQAAVRISDAFRTSSADRLNVGLHLMWVYEKLVKSLCMALVRMASGPTWDFLTSFRTAYGENPITPYYKLSPLEKLEKGFVEVYGTSILDSERIKAIARPRGTRP